jgi:hypothetical protein
MAPEHKPRQSTNIAAENMAIEKSEQPKPENAGAKELEKNTVQEATSQEKSLGRLRLSIIAVALWFAVFLYSLVSVRHFSGHAKKLTCGNYTGHYYRVQCNPQHYGRVPQYLRCWMVRK